MSFQLCSLKNKLFCQGDDEDLEIYDDAIENYKHQIKDLELKLDEAKSDVENKQKLLDGFNRTISNDDNELRESSGVVRNETENSQRETVEETVVREDENREEILSLIDEAEDNEEELLMNQIEIPQNDQELDGEKVDSFEERRDVLSSIHIESEEENEGIDKPSESHGESEGNGTNEKLEEITNLIATVKSETIELENTANQMTLKVSESSDEDDNTKMNFHDIEKQYLGNSIKKLEEKLTSLEMSHNQILSDFKKQNDQSIASLTRENGLLKEKVVRLTEKVTEREKAIKSMSYIVEHQKSSSKDLRGIIVSLESQLEMERSRSKNGEEDLLKLRLERISSFAKGSIDALESV